MKLEPIVEKLSEINFQQDRSWHRGVMVITTVQLHSEHPESDSAQVQILLAACRRLAMLRVADNFPQLEIRLNAFRRATIPQK